MDNVGNVDLMKIFSFNARHGNVGDDLNHVLWPLVFGDEFFSDDDTRLFIGIGSVLDDRHQADGDHRHVVFGAGLRNKRTRPRDIDKFDIRFVRGPKSAKLLDRNNTRWISDPAILAPLYIKQGRDPVVGRIGYIPYFGCPEDLTESIRLETGAHIIMPTLPPKEFISELLKCEHVISEAMHGAILADAYRIPWQGCRLMSGIMEGRTNLFKWEDWMSSLKICASIPSAVPRVALYAPKSIRARLGPLVRARAIPIVQKMLKDQKWILSDPEVLKSAQEVIIFEVDRLRLRTHNQNGTVAARATAERKAGSDDVTAPRRRL